MRHARPRNKYILKITMHCLYILMNKICNDNVPTYSNSNNYLWLSVYFVSHDFTIWEIHKIIGIYVGEHKLCYIFSEHNQL